MGSIKKLLSLSLLMMTFIACSSSSRTNGETSDKGPQIQHQKDFTERTAERGTNAVER
jgi:hypothetical protein